MSDCFFLRLKNRFAFLRLKVAVSWRIVETEEFTNCRRFAHLRIPENCVDEGLQACDASVNETSTEVVAEPFLLWQREISVGMEQLELGVETREVSKAT